MDLSSLTQQQIGQLPPSQSQVIHDTVASSKFPPVTLKTLADMAKFMDQEVEVTFFGMPQTLTVKRAYNLLRLTESGSDAPAAPVKPKPKTTPLPASLAVSLGTKRPAPSQSTDTPVPAAKKHKVDPPKTSRTTNTKRDEKPQVSRPSTVIAPAGSPTKQDTKVATIEYGSKMFLTTPPEPLKPQIEGKYYFKNHAPTGDRAQDLKDFGKHGCNWLFYEKIFPYKPALVNFSKGCKLVITPRAFKGNPNLKSDLLGRLDNTTFALHPVPNWNKEFTNPSSIWCADMVSALGSHTTMAGKPSKNGWDMPIYYPEAFLAEVTPDVAQLLRSVNVVPKKYFRMPAGWSFGAGRELLIHLYKKNADVFIKLNTEYGTDEGPKKENSTSSQSYSKMQVSRSNHSSSSSSSSADYSSEDEEVVEVSKPVPKERPIPTSSLQRPKTLLLPNSKQSTSTSTPKPNTNAPSFNRSTSSGAQDYRRVKTDVINPVPDLSELEAADSVLQQEQEEARLRDEQAARQNGKQYFFSANGTEVEAM